MRQTALRKAEEFFHRREKENIKKNGIFHRREMNNKEKNGVRSQYEEF